MKAKAPAAIATTIAIVALSACPGVGAAAKPANRHPKPTYKTIKASVIESFYLAGSHGFLIVASLRDRHALTLTVLPTHGRASA